MQELLYTSVPRGLKPGSRGFSTVLSTQGMVAPLAAALEALSGYRPVFPIGHARVAENPIVYSHLKLQVAGKSWYVLSRVADYGLDYSQRTNKLAHHLVLDKSELPAAGPASLLRASGIMRESWEGEPKIVPPKPMSKHPIAPSGMCQAWKEMTGDAGWAGVLAESFLKDANRPVILLFEPGQDLRPLIDESLSLLPAERRWDVTFSTYFTGSSQGITCLWRGIVLGSKEATESLRFVNALRIDLTSTDIGRAEGGELVEAARKGTRPTARPTLPPIKIASREQPEPQVVVMDNSDEPTVSRTTYENAETEHRTAPVASHDHSKAPPRLTRSAFKFANARRQTDADDPTAGTSLGRKSVLLFAVALLLVCLIVAGVFVGPELAKHWPKGKGAALAGNLNQPSASPDAPIGDAPQPITNAAVDGQSSGGAEPTASKANATPGEAKNPEKKENALDHKPAIYTVELEPQQAVLEAEGDDVTVTGEGKQRTVTVAKPDSDKAVVLIARLDGFREDRRTLHPAPGVSEKVPMKLSRNEPPDEKKELEKQPRSGEDRILLALPKVDSTDETMLHEFSTPFQIQELKLIWLAPQCDEFKSFKSIGREQSLVLLHKEAGEDKKVATFSVRDSKLFFLWASDSNQPLRSRVVQKAQFCVLEMKESAKSHRRFVFHAQNKIMSKGAFTSGSIKLIEDSKSDVAKLLSQAVETKIPLTTNDVVIEFGDKQWEFERVKDKAFPNRTECHELATEFGQKSVRIELNIKDAALKIEVVESEFDEEKKALVKSFKTAMEQASEKHGSKYDRLFSFSELKNKEGVQKQINEHFQTTWKSKNGGGEGWSKASTETVMALESYFEKATTLAGQIDKAPNHARDIRKKSHFVSATMTYRVTGDGAEPLEVELLRFESDKPGSNPSK